MRHDEKKSPRGGRHHDPHERHDHPGERSRMRHGNVRAALLLALEEGPAHGYELGLRLERISAGAWRPSPGSIYPILQALADEDCVSVDERDGKRVYALTKTGQSEIRERRSRGEEPPWQFPGGERSGALREAVVALKMAARQIGSVGTADQQARALEILVDARRRLYELLANG